MTLVWYLRARAGGSEATLTPREEVLPGALGRVEQVSWSGLDVFDQA